MSTNPDNPEINSTNNPQPNIGQNAVQTPESLEYRAEVKQLLNILAQSGAWDMSVADLGDTETLGEMTQLYRATVFSFIPALFTLVPSDKTKERGSVGMTVPLDST